MRGVEAQVLVVSGDVAQRSLSGELQRGAAILRDAGKRMSTIIVPGNHDVAWWMSPLHLFGTDGMYTRYRKYISRDLEPVLRVPGASFIGVNTSHGFAPYTLTTRLRDISIVGAVTDAQLARVDAACVETPPGDARVIVMHHNPTFGSMSKRFGVKGTPRVVSRLTQAGADLILCGHDHQEAVERPGGSRGPVICVAGTLSNRSRGGRPSSFFELAISPTSIAVTTLFWQEGTQAFVASSPQCFARSSAGA